MGYGDIGVETQVEFIIALFLMFAGVLFYSNILGELLTMIDQSLEKQEKIQVKFHLLKLLQKDIKLDKHLIREIKRNIESIEDKDDDVRYRPKFEGVLERDAEDLLYEAHEKEFRGINLFTRKDKDFLIEFALACKKESFNKGQMIYEKDEKSNFFYVLKRGSIGYCLPGERSITFYECHGGYFGEMELIKDKLRMFTIKALEEDTTIFKISKPVFYDLFLERERKFKLTFMEVAKKREKEIDDAYKHVKNLAAKLLDEIREEFNQENPFYKFQQIVRGPKFKKLLEERKKLTKKEKKEFLRMQKRRKTKKKTIYAEINPNFAKPSSPEPGHNLDRAPLPVPSQNHSSRNVSQKKYEISQSLGARLRREQMSKRGKKKYLKVKKE